MKILAKIYAKLNTKILIGVCLALSGVTLSPEIITILNTLTQ